MQYHAASMRAIAIRLGVPHLKYLSEKPAMTSLYRVTAYYVDGRARHSIGTLYHIAGNDEHRLDIIHEGFFNNRPRTHMISDERYTRLTAAFRRANFDTLPDQPPAPTSQMTYWLVERAAGAFYRGVLMSPHRPLMPYSIIVNAIDGYLLEAIREIEP